MARPLYDRLKEYADKVKARFCMPGHSGIDVEEERLFSASVFDWTEVEGLDNLLDSSEVILQSEKNLAKRYGYKHALMLTEGATIAMQIAINVAKRRSENVVAYGDMHKSFWSACSLFNLKVSIADNLDELQSLAKEKNIGGIFVTSPDYFGNVKNLKDLSDMAKKIGALLIVDEAHSAHFVYSSLLPDNAHEYADIALVGMHKTLPVFGGGGMIGINGKKIYEECRMIRAMLHSTSPSYLIMASIDYALDLMERKGEIYYAELKKRVQDFSQKLKKGKVLDTRDFSRVVIKFEGKDCYELNHILSQKGIFAETAYGDTLVLIVTPFNMDKLDMLADVLDNIELKDSDKFVLPILKHLDILGSEIELVDILDAEGRQCGGEIGIYPPGVPVIHKGDIFDEEAVLFVKKYKNRLFGLASGKVAVIK